MDKLDLSYFEREALKVSLDPPGAKRSMRRRRHNPLVWATALAFVAALWGSLMALVCLITLYILFSVIENLRAYQTLTVYSSVMRKMEARIKELESLEESV